MRKLGIILLVLVFVISLMAGAMPVAANGLGSISGHVYGSDNTTPISGALVNVYDYLSPYTYQGQTTTDVNGSYTLSSLGAGQHKVWAIAAAHAAEFYNGVHNFCQANPVTVTAGDTSNIDFYLESSGGHISGYVYESNGVTGISGAMVMVYDYNRFPTPGCFEGASVTDDTGLYTTSGLPAGLYRLWATAAGHAGEWYNDTYNYFGATYVTVTAPGLIAGKNFSLATGGSVSGTVTDGTDPIAGAVVIAYDRDMLNHFMLNPLGIAFTDASGNYTLPLNSGSYTIRAKAAGYAAEWYNNKYDMLAADAVTVTAPDDTPDIDFALAAGGTISGNVSDSTDPIGGALVIIFDFDQLVDDGVIFVYDIACTDENGDYTTVGVPADQYAVRAAAIGYGYSYASEMYDDHYDRRDADAVEVTGTDNTPGIDFVLDAGGGISGNVTDGTNPIGGAMVFAYDYDLLPSTLVSYAITWTNSEGDYSLFGLPTGSYGVKVTAAGYADEWYDSEHDAGLATEVEVTVPDNTLDIDFSLITPPDAPTGFTATAFSSSQIDLSWTAGTGAQDTMVRRSEIAFPTATDAGDPVYFGIGTGTSDTGLTPNTTFYYSAWSWVEGSDVWSDTHATAQATTQAAPPPAIPPVVRDYSIKGSIKFFDWKCNKWIVVQSGILHITYQDEENPHKIKGYFEPGISIEGWPASDNVDGYVGPFERDAKLKIKNKPRLSLVAELGTYCEYPSLTYVTYIINGAIKWDKKTDTVKSIKCTINGWGEFGPAFDDESPKIGQFEGKFTATPIPIK